MPSTRSISSASYSGSAREAILFGAATNGEVCSTLGNSSRGSALDASTRDGGSALARGQDCGSPSS